MLRLLTAVAAGIIFGLGLAISQMVNPQKVLAFLDFAGDWDPSLAFVMGGAVGVALIPYRFTLRRAKPLLAERFSLPQVRDIDARLVGGSAVFGAGWGLVGFCPGPAIASFAYAMPESLVFVVAMVAGVVLARAVPERPAAQPAGA